MYTVIFKAVKFQSNEALNRIKAVTRISAPQGGDKSNSAKRDQVNRPPKGERGMEHILVL
jgi:hypothetical protein